MFQLLMGPGGSRTRLVMLAVVIGVILLVVHKYRLSSTDHVHHATSLEWRQGEHVSRISTMHNYSMGLVWPVDDVNDDNDRIVSQIDIMNTYAQQKRNRKLKVILRVGSHCFEHWVAGQEQFVRDKCPITDCWNTNNQSQAPDADALVISEFRESTRHLYLPKPRGQIWIALHRDSPLHHHIDAKSLYGLINWTTSFRHDSTIAFRILHKFVPSRPATTAVTSGKKSINYAAGKTKLVAWFVSDCRGANNRMIYAKELSQFIQVDVYGACGTLKCSKLDRQNCFKMLERDYKFYLSFENSNCDDYITEKFWEGALRNKVLPVVMGAKRRQYEAIAPVNSFLHVDDFSGPRQLADYLHLLAANDTLYNEYFRWRQTKWSPVNMYQWCRLCALLHWRDEVDYVSWYDDYDSWWIGACRRPQNLPWFQRNRGNRQHIRDDE